MAVVEELIRSEADGSISFGNHSLSAKSKVEDYNHNGDSYKVKTYDAMTKLEKNGLFVYESVPGTSVIKYNEKEDGVEFLVDGENDAQLTIGLSDDTEYEVFVDGNSAGCMKTNMGGKLVISLELQGKFEQAVKIVRK